MNSAVTNLHHAQHNLYGTVSSLVYRSYYSMSHSMLLPKVQLSVNVFIYF